MTSSAFYLAVGPSLARYEVEDGRLAQVLGDTVRLPAQVQYAWRHPTRPILYVASSNRSAHVDDLHHVTAFAMAPGTGALAMIGQPTPLPSRPISITVDAAGALLLAAYNLPSDITVHEIADDGTVGAAIAHEDALDTGVFAHQVRTLPSGRTALLVTRGNDAQHGKPEDPGALKLYALEAGVLSDRQSVAPQGGTGFGPRHVDIHPNGRWLYAALERGNRLQTYVIGADDRLSAEPIFDATTLAEPAKVRPGQVAGAIHVSPDGRFVYVGNRADGKLDMNGTMVFGGGENSIAVFAIDPDSGEPRLVQAAPTESFHVRTFSLDPSGRMLVAASILPMTVASGGGFETVPAMLSVFVIGPDGRLTHDAQHPLETGEGPAFWCGFVALD